MAEMNSLRLKKNTMKYPIEKIEENIPPISPKRSITE
jgi:hypothetical protein